MKKAIINFAMFSIAAMVFISCSKNPSIFGDGPQIVLDEKEKIDEYIWKNGEKELGSEEKEKAIELFKDLRKDVGKANEDIEGKEIAYTVEEGTPFKVEGKLIINTFTPDELNYKFTGCKIVPIEDKLIKRLRDYIGMDGFFNALAAIFVDENGEPLFYITDLKLFSQINPDNLEYEGDFIMEIEPNHLEDATKVRSIVFADPFNSKLYNKCKEDEKKRGELSSNYSKKYADLWYESKSEEN